TTNGPPREPARWSARATVCFPVPGSPERSTGQGTARTRSSSRKRATQGGADPRTPAMERGRAPSGNALSGKGTATRRESSPVGGAVVGCSSPCGRTCSSLHGRTGCVHGLDKGILDERERFARGALGCCTSKWEARDEQDARGATRSCVSRGNRCNERVSLLERRPRGPFCPRALRP